MSDEAEAAGAPEAKKQKTMTKITEGVEFDTIAREWRCKWSADNGKKSLQELQAALDGAMDDLRAIEGLIGAQRIVCGGCLDFKVIVSLAEDKFGAWEAAKFAPEGSFLETIGKIEGVSVVETQTYTLMPMI